MNLMVICHHETFYDQNICFSLVASNILKIYHGFYFLAESVVKNVPEGQAVVKFHGANTMWK